MTFDRDRTTRMTIVRDFPDLISSDLKLKLKKYKHHKRIRNLMTQKMK